MSLNCRVPRGYNNVFILIQLINSDKVKCIDNSDIDNDIPLQTVKVQIQISTK